MTRRLLLGIAVIAVVLSAWRALDRPRPSARVQALCGEFAVPGLNDRGNQIILNADGSCIYGLRKGTWKLLSGGFFWDDRIVFDLEGDASESGAVTAQRYSVTEPVYWRGGEPRMLMDEDASLYYIRTKRP